MTPHPFQAGPALPHARRPRLLDLFCCEGGAARGYTEAGFDVVGVDVDGGRRARYLESGAVEFHEGDANAWPLDGFDAAHASPPCQDHSATKSFAGPRHGTGWMLEHTIARLQQWGGPWIVENVEAADMPGSLVLCGSEFGLRTADGWHLKRHRRFVSNLFLMGAGGCSCLGRRIAGVYGHGPTKPGNRGVSLEVARAREIMDMPWASRYGTTQAIPPAYTRFLGEQLMAHLRAVAA